MAKVVIIGAGLTGISAAYHLEQKKFFDYVMLEKDATVGGLCRSVIQDGFTFDYTGHLLHSSDPYFHNLLASICGLEHFNTIQRRSFIYSQNVYTHYPIQINLHGLPINTITRCIEGFLHRKKSKCKPKSFYEWALQQFGSGLARYFFFPYQQKIFSYNIKKITASWTGRFVPKTSLSQILQGALQPPENTVGYNAHFYYPKEGGIISWVQKLAATLHNPIYTNHAVTHIDMRTKTVTTNQGATFTYDYLLNTTPLDQFLNRVKEPSNISLRAAADKLLCNSVLNFNLGFSRPDVSDKHWIYFPEKEYPFYRLGFPHNFAHSMAPIGCSSLYGELSYLKNSTSTVQKKLKTALEATKKVLGIADHDIMTEKIINIPHAYVIYDFWRERYLPRLLQQLQDHAIFSIGRYGSWKYSSMQEAVLDGKTCVDQLVL